MPKLGRHIYAHYVKECFGVRRFKKFRNFFKRQMRVHNKWIILFKLENGERIHVMYNKFNNIGVALQNLGMDLCLD